MPVWYANLSVQKRRMPNLFLYRQDLVTQRQAKKPNQLIQPSPNAEPRSKLELDAQGNLLLEVVTAGNMMNKKRYDQLLIGRNIRVELQIPPNYYDNLTTLRRGCTLEY